jgi:hypothetical protein
MTTPLPDTWASTDLPVLGAAIELCLEAPGQLLRFHELVDRLSLPYETVRAAMLRLDSASPSYLKVVTEWGDDDGLDIVLFGQPAERGLRAVGAWPTPESALDRLIEAMEARAEQTGSEEERSKARDVVAWFGNAGRDFMINAIAGVVSGSIVAG